MDLKGIQDILNAKVIIGAGSLGKEINFVYSSDLMSDVLAFVKPGALLLTALTNSQVVRTAEIADLSAVCFVCGKEPQEDTLKLAGESGIPLLITNLTMYEACGLLFKEGVSHHINSDIKWILKKD